MSGHCDLGQSRYINLLVATPNQAANVLVRCNLYQVFRTEISDKLRTRVYRISNHINDARELLHMSNIIQKLCGKSTKL